MYRETKKVECFVFVGGNNNIKKIENLVRINIQKIQPNVGDSWLGLNKSGIEFVKK